MNFRSEKGVTLIALVVTVIVLLILAGISITTITDEDKGVVTKVKDAKRMAEENSDQEVADVKEIMGYVKKEDTSTGNINSGNTDNGSTSGDESEEDTLIDTSEPEEDILPEDDILESEETISGNLIPSGGVYTKSDGTVLTAGNLFPDTVTTGDQYSYGDYEYKYNYLYDYDRGSGVSTIENTTQNGWSVRVKSESKTSYGKILEYIAGKNITSLQYAFASCSYFSVAPEIPSTVTNLQQTFNSCDKLTTAPSVIPASVTNMQATFCSCLVFTGTIVINANPTKYGVCFYFTTKTIKLTGASTKLSVLAGTDSNGNVTVASS